MKIQKETLSSVAAGRFAARRTGHWRILERRIRRRTLNASMLPIGPESGAAAIARTRNVDSGGLRRAQAARHACRSRRGEAALARAGVVATTRPCGALVALAAAARTLASARLTTCLVALLELVERGGRRGERRLERVDGDVRAGRRRLAGLVDPRGDALGVGGPRFFGQRRVLRLRFGGEFVQALRVAHRGLHARLRRAWRAASSSSWTSLTPATACALSTPCASAALAASRLTLASFSAFSIASAASLVACATLVLLISANCSVALYMAFLFEWKCPVDRPIPAARRCRVLPRAIDAGTRCPGLVCCTAQNPL